MFGKIFGKKEGMYDMQVYWADYVNIEDLMADLETLGELMARPSAFEKGNRIVTVRNWWINDTKYKMAELYVDKTTERFIGKLLENKKFVAVKFTSTAMTRNGKVI